MEFGQVMTALKMRLQEIFKRKPDSMEQFRDLAEHPVDTKNVSVPLT